MPFDEAWFPEEELRAEWAKWVVSLGEWHVFGGLTYDQRRRRVDGHTLERVRPGADIVRRHALRWLRDGLGDRSREVEAAVVALEYQKNGWPHLHPLLRLTGGLLDGDISRLGRAWFAAHGGNRLEAPRGVGEVAAYAAKYLVKDLSKGDVIFWPLRGPLAASGQSRTEYWSG